MNFDQLQNKNLLLCLIANMAEGFLKVTGAGRAPYLKPANLPVSGCKRFCRIVFAKIIS
jgi:hypothetical protein